MHAQHNIVTLVLVIVTIIIIQLNLLFMSSCGIKISKGPNMKVVSQLLKGCGKCLYQEGK